MYALTVCFGPSGMSWRLLFKTKESADAAKNYLSIDSGGALRHVTVNDDFGQNARIEAKSIHGWMLEDLDLSKVGTQEFMLHQERMKVSIQRAAEADPTLRTARMTQGPAMLNPMGNGRWPS